MSERYDTKKYRKLNFHGEPRADLLLLRIMECPYPCLEYITVLLNMERSASGGNEKDF